MRVSWPVLTDRSWLAAILSLDLLFVSVSAIKCLQCTSLLQSRVCQTGDMSATDCPSEDDRYCTKLTADSDGFVFRSCGKTEKKDCEMTDISGMVMKVCFHTCYTDGCNAAMIVTSLPLLLTVGLLCTLVLSELTVLTAACFF